MRDTPTCFPILTILYLVSNGLYFHVRWRKARHFDVRTVDSFALKRDWGSPCWPWMTGFKNTTDVYSIYLELRMASPYQISTGKWKYVNPCLDFLGISDQHTTYVKRQVRPGWTYVRRSSVIPDLENLASQSGRRYWKHHWTSHPGFLLWLVGFCASEDRLPFPSRSYRLSSFRDQGMPTVICNNPPGHTFESP